MKILDSKIRHNKQFANPPTLELLVDKVLYMGDMIFESKKIDNGKTAYFAEKDGQAIFFVHDPKAEYGYGGSIFTVTLNTGEVVKVKGPWSSGPSFIGPIFYVELMDVSLTDDKAAFDRGYTFYAGHCTVEKAQEVVLPENYRLVCKKKYDELVWELEEIV